MQLLPVSNTSGNGTPDTRTTAPGRSGLDFMKLLTDSLAAAPAEVTPELDIATSTNTGRGSDAGLPLASTAADSAYTDDDLQAVEAPYNEKVEPNVPLGADTPVEEIRLTDNELHGVIKSLRENGADDETLSRVAALLGNPGGTPVTEVVKAVANVASAKLTDGDLQRIGSLADRLDAKGELKTALLDDLKNGRTQQAMLRFTEALNNAMGENSSQKFSADKNELLALAKALKVDPKVMESIEKNFGRKDSKTISLEEFKTMMVPVEEHMAKFGKQQEKVAGLLETALKPAVDTARNRLEKEAEASGKVSRRTEQSETLIRDSVTRNGLAQAGGAEMQDKTEKAAERGDKSEKADTIESRLTRTTGTEGQQKSANDTGNGNAAQDPKSQKAVVSVEAEAAEKALDAKAQKAQDSKAGLSGAAGATGTDGKGAGLSGQSGKTVDPWEALLSKLDVKVEAATARTAKTDAQPVAGNFTVAQSMQNNPGNRSVNVGNTQAARVLSQVEQGVFSAMADGTKRLTLNLNPVELGAVSVMLSSKNGEVSATLKPERMETAAMLAQQVDALKANLEQQGIKVDKVEVQTPQQQNQHNNWQGTDQHNASQEHQAQQDALSRMRRVRDADTQSFSSSAQAMRHAARAGTSSSSLNLVA